MAVQILIVEDEDWAKDSLLDMLETIQGFDFEGVHLKTIRDAKLWLQKNKPDLIFMDIHLADGLSFHIFEDIQVQAPVIFTTAYDNYALDAYRNQGYAYLLKPYELSDLMEALARVKPLLPSFSEEKQSYKTRFLVKYGVYLKSIAVTDIAYFMADDKLLYVAVKQGDQYIVEDTISNLASKLDPNDFFQVNRKFIVHIGAIRDMVKISRNRIRLTLSPAVASNIEVVVSEEKSNIFQKWLDR
ncbi:LytR/AlgR family response regulator transcription factor [Sphingobacterium sp. Mn56C]|uniref:LytR/AlgR family response regulator transcription factor n=1 Tax=Sphingobacterium sp. Mn56C TaxID=3395261 RepID=UPI003BECB2BB